MITTHFLLSNFLYSNKGSIINYFTAESNPCCDDPSHSQNEPYTTDWWTCVDEQCESCGTRINVTNCSDHGNLCPTCRSAAALRQPYTNDFEYYTADVLYDMTHPPDNTHLMEAFYGDDY